MPRVLAPKIVNFHREFFELNMVLNDIFSQQHQINDRKRSRI